MSAKIGQIAILSDDYDNDHSHFTNGIALSIIGYACQANVSAREIVSRILDDLREHDGEDWWCPCCGPISGELVTDTETCANCGHGVF